MGVKPCGMVGGFGSSKSILVLVNKLVLHDQVMIDRDGWGDVCMRGREVKFDDPTADKQKRKHSSITLPLIKNDS